MGKNFRQFAAGYNLALKFGAMVACPVFASLFAGIFVDKKLNTAPLMMFVFMALGLSFSVYAVYRVARRMQESSQDKKENEA